MSNEDAPVILVVEDEKEMAELLRQALQESGYQVRVAHDGRQGLAAAEGADLIIADVMMPVMDGVQMVEKIRQAGRTMPVLFLTAKDSTTALVEGLSAGADDYIAKPFELAVLFAKVQAHLRRGRLSADIVRFADLTLDRRQRTAQRGGRELYLSATEVAMLEVLMLNQGEPVSKQAMIREVWHDEAYRDDNIVEVYINHLRKKTEYHRQPRIVHTVRGKGYLLGKADE